MVDNHDDQINPVGDNSNLSITLFKDRRPDSCFVDQIYDPDKDGEWTESSPKLIPNEGAQVIDRDTGILYYVVSVNEDTLKTTLAPSRILVTGESGEVVKILNYGNDKFMLYFDDRTKPTKIIIDSKLVVYGASLSEYRLVRTTPGKEREIISLYVENNEEYKGDRIPLTNVGTGSSTKALTNCHTLSYLEDGDVVEAEIFDYSGIQNATVELFVKRATLLNDLLSSTSVITGFDAECNQMMTNRDFYIYQRQDPSHLGITPIVTYSNGATEELVVDNSTCFIYGLNEFVPSFPGQRQKVLIKKFLSTRQSSDLAVVEENAKYISCEKWVHVMGNETIDNIKVSVIPVYNYDRATYELKLVAYSDRRTSITEVTPYVSYNTALDGTLYHSLQMVEFAVDLQELLGLEGPSVHVQKVYVELKPPSMFQKYIIADDTESGVFYGVESSTIRRPIISYDQGTGQYYIPTSRFGNLAAFLEAFYYKSQPPFDTDVEVTPTIPTHFTIRDIDTLGAIIPTPVEVGQYDQYMNMVPRLNGGNYVGNTVIVEFLTNVADEYQIIYGVPVDIHSV